MPDTTPNPISCALHAARLDRLEATLTEIRDEFRTLNATVAISNGRPSLIERVNRLDSIVNGVKWHAGALYTAIAGAIGKFIWDNVQNGGK